MVPLQGAQGVASAARQSNLDRKDCFASFATTRFHLWDIVKILTNTFFRECTPMIPGARDFFLTVEMTASFVIPNECEESRFMLNQLYPRRKASFIDGAGISAP